MKIRTPVILTIISFFFLLPLKWLSQLKILGEEVPFSLTTPGFAAVLIAVAAIVVFCSLSAKGTRIRVNTKQSITMGFVMLIAACAVLFDGAIAYMGYNSTKALVFGADTQSYYTLDAFRYIFQSDYGIDLPKSLLLSALLFSGKKGLYYAISCVIGAVGFLLMSYDFFGGRNFFRKKPLFALLPTVWGVARIVCTYIFFTSLADLNANYLDILFICSTLIFLFAQARLFADLNAYKSVKTAVAAGLCSVIFSMCSNFVRCMALITGRGDNLPDLSRPNLCDIVITLMIAAYIIYIIAPRAHKPIDVAEIPESTDIDNFVSGRPLNNQPRLFINNNSDVNGQPQPPKAQTIQPAQSDSDDYYYGDFDSKGRRIVLPANMTARGTLSENTYKLRKASPLSPNARINKRLR